MNWLPIGGATLDGAKVLARDADGMWRWTWLEDGVWIYEGWRETEDRQEYAAECWWEPVEFTPDG